MFDFFFPRFFKYFMRKETRPIIDQYQELIDALIEIVDKRNSVNEDSFSDWFIVSTEILNQNNTVKDEESPSETEQVTVDLQSNPSSVFKSPLEPNNIIQQVVPLPIPDQNEKDDQSKINDEKHLQKDSGHSILKGATSTVDQCAPIEAIQPETSISPGPVSNSSDSGSGLNDGLPASTLQIDNGTQSTSNQTTRRVTFSTDPLIRKRVANRLDVSKMGIKPALVVTIEEQGWKQDGSRTKRVFDSVYSTLGRHSAKIIGVVVEENFIKLYTENEVKRSIILHELKQMSQFVRETSPFLLNVQNPLKPSIQFLCCAETYKMPSSDVITLLRQENDWNDDWLVNIESKEWIRKLRKAKLSLIIDSRIRDKIDQEDGIISVNGKETKVFDKFGISQCSVCLRFGHSKCRSRIRCFFCSGFHSDKYQHDKYSDNKYCFLCRLSGHTPISKNCPTLIQEIRSKIELIDYKYNEIFVGTDRAY